MRTSLMNLRAVATLLAVVIFVSAGSALAAEKETFEAGTGKYILVLKDGQTEVTDPATGLKKAKEPDVVKRGGKVLHEKDAVRIIKLPNREARELRKEENVAYVQRVWMGESRESWSEEDRTSSLQAEPEPTLEALETNLTWETGQYLYDGSGNIKQIGGDTYRYDSAGRLIEATVKSITETYKYDSFGNLTEKSLSGVPGVIQVDSSSNRLKGETYDAAGNVITRAGTPRYGYDSFSMMDTVVKPTPALTQRILYGPDDERIAVIHEPGSLSRWKIRDFGGRVLREHRVDDQYSTWHWMEDYVYGEGRLLAGERESAFGGKRHFHTDHLGTVRMITNQSRMRIAVHDFYPFGVEQTDATQEYHRFAGTYASGDFRSEPMKFTSHERDWHGWLNADNDDSLDYMHARYYDPNLGRFLSVDPTWESAVLGKPQTWNRYAYVMSNPVNLTDPDGKCPLCWDVLEELVGGDTPLSENGYDPKVSDNPPRTQAEFDQRVRDGRAVRPSTMAPGPHADESIPARNSQPKFTPEERAKMNEVGRKSGCHTCGSTDPKTKSGNFVPDHQPPSSVNPPDQPQKLYPHCIECSRKQGGQVRKFLIELAEKARKIIPGI